MIPGGPRPPASGWCTPKGGSPGLHFPTDGEHAGPHLGPAWGGCVSAGPWGDSTLGPTGGAAEGTDCRQERHTLGDCFYALVLSEPQNISGQRGDQSPTAGTDLKTQAFPGSRQGCSTARMKAVPGQSSLPCSSRSHTRQGLGKPAQHPGPSTQRRESGPGAGSHLDVRGRV